MDEKRIVELLTRKFAGEASEEELIELNELVARYPDSSYLEDLFTKIWNSKVEGEDVSFFYRRHKRRRQREFNEVHAGAKEYSGDLKHKRNKFLIGAFSIVMLLSAAGYLFFSMRKKTAKLPAYTQIISGKGVRKSVTLPDGSTVRLNSDSRLSFDGDMERNSTRIVELSGEAYFDIVNIPARPFIIHTSKVSIKVLGTALNVNAYPNDKKCETTLIRGTIELSTNDGAKQKFILKPSEKFSVIEAKTTEGGMKSNNKRIETSTVLIENIAPVKLADKEYVPETSWTENKLIFENESLEDLVPKFERWFNVKIIIVGENPAGYRFTGAFANETIEQALTAMKLIKPFNFTIHDKNITIY